MILLISGCTGLGTSRWAMDDSVYEDKYDKPYAGDDGSQYHLTTLGRSNDFWFFGISLAFLEL
jgi:hypothetical protein